jgi:hypothetical protein
MAERILRSARGTFTLREADFATAEDDATLEARLADACKAALEDEVRVHIFRRSPLHYAVFQGPRAPLFPVWWDLPADPLPAPKLPARVR